MDEYESVSQSKSVCKMTECGKRGKPYDRLPTLSTLFGNPFGITTFPRPRLWCWMGMMRSRWFDGVKLFRMDRRRRRLRR